MKYEYMKEYPCNKGRPEGLDDDVLVECRRESDRSWYGHSKPIDWWCWPAIYKFRIVDERYEPKSEDVYTNACGIRACNDREDWERCGTDASDFELSVTQTDSEILDVSVTKNATKPDWFERGDLPPVGEVVSFYKDLSISYIAGFNWKDGDEIEILAHKEGAASPVAVAWNNSTLEARGIVLECLKPIRTEHDELMDEVATAIYKGRARNRTSEDIAIALYDAGMLKKPD